MLIQKMKCPRGCESATFLESVKTVIENGSNLLLDSQNQSQQNTKNIKVYTCNCCHNSFEISENSVSGKMVL
jgi:hypothetical protein